MDLEDLDSSIENVLLPESLSHTDLNDGNILIIIDNSSSAITTTTTVNDIHNIEFDIMDSTTNEDDTANTLPMNDDAHDNGSDAIVQAEEDGKQMTPGGENIIADFIAAAGQVGTEDELVEEEETQKLSVEDNEVSDLTSVSFLPTTEETPEFHDDEIPELQTIAVENEIPELQTIAVENEIPELQTIAVENEIPELQTIAIENEIKKELEEEGEEEEAFQDNYVNSPRSRSISPCFHLSPPPLPPQPLYLSPSPSPPPSSLPSTIIMKTEEENELITEKLSLVQNSVKTEAKDDENDEEDVDIQSQIVFCRCCGCFGLVSEFYGGMYCTKACNNSYIFITSQGQDGKFKKPITPVLNKKPKLSCIENEQSYTNDYKNNNNDNSGCGSSSSSSIYDNHKPNNINNKIESSLNNHHNVENNFSVFNQSTSNSNNHFNLNPKAPVVRKLINKRRATNGGVKRNGNNKKMITATKTSSAIANEQESFVNSSISRKNPNVQSRILKNTGKTVVISPNKGKNQANNVKLGGSPLKGGLTGSKTTESSPTRAPSVRGIQRTKSVELPPTTFSYSRDRKRNFPQIFSKRLLNKTSPERKTPFDSPSTSSSCSSSFDTNAASSSSSYNMTSTVSSSFSGNRNTNIGDFDWSKYLQDTKTKSAPHRLFRQPTLPPKNPFKCGMMLEAIDPQHQSLICVAQVVGVQGYRLRLRFQGFSEAYDFWVNADSLEIFPPCWCEQNGLYLVPPPGMETFNWHQYMVENEIDVAPRDIFAVTKEDFSIESSGVKIGWKLEAVDIRNQNLVCVATVANVMGDRILVHFDSWDSLYDYWADLTSPFIHPVGWCDQNNVKLTPPNDYKDFTWEKYIREEKTQAMPTRLFRLLPPVGFKKGFKIECVDKRNPSLIRVATIAEVEEHQLHIHFDGWPSMYDYKVYELSPDIHPVGWCINTGHPLQPPPSLSTDGSWTGPCPVFGCLGMGHMRGPKFLTHNSEKNCPYALNNYKKDWILADRLVLLERNMNQSHNGDMSTSSIDSTQKLGSDHSVDTKTTVKTSGVKRKRTCFSTRRKKTKRSKNQVEINSDIQNSKVKTSNNNKNNMLIHNNSYNDVRNFVVKKEIIKKPNITDKTVSNIIQQQLQPEILNDKTGVETKNIKKEEIEEEGEKEVKHKQPFRNSRNKIVRTQWRAIRKPRGRKINQDSSSSTLTNLSIQNPDEIKSEKDQNTTSFQSKKVPKPVPKRLRRLVNSSLDDTTTTKVSNVNSHDLLERAVSVSNLSLSSHYQIKDEDGPEVKRRRISLPSNPSSSSSNNSRSSSKKHNTTSFPTSNNVSEGEPEFPHNYVAHSLTLKKIVGSIDEKTVSQWKVHNLAEFVARIPGCKGVSKTFTEHLIDGESFLMLSQNDFIKVMGLKLGPAIKLYNVLRIIGFNSTTNSAS